MPKHLSHSQANMFLRCPAQWRYRYIMGLKQPPTGPLHFGISVHTGLKENYEQKVKTEHDLSVADVTDKFDEVFQNDSEVDWQENNKDEFREAGLKLVDLHMKQEAPAIFPMAVEEKITIQVKGIGVPIITIPDLITQRGEIIDFKTTGKSPARRNGEYVASESDARQIALYSHPFKAVYGYDCIDAIVKYHVRLKRAPKIVTVHAVVTPQRGQFAVEQIGRVEKAIQACEQSGVFIPNRSHMMCSEKQCGYWKRCHEEFGPTEEVEEMKEEINHG